MSWKKEWFFKIKLKEEPHRRIAYQGISGSQLAYVAELKGGIKINKLETIRQELHANSDAIVYAIGMIDNLTKKHRLKLWNHVVEFTVVPRNGLYAADKLQKFMMGLIALKPTHVVKFEENAKGIKFGRIYFDEEIGTEKIIITLIDKTDKELFETQGFQDGQMVVEKPLKRAVRIFVVPDIEMAKKAFKGGRSKHWASWQELEESRSRLTQLQFRSR